MRADVLLSLQRKLVGESAVREHITRLCVWLAISGVFVLLFTAGMVYAGVYVWHAEATDTNSEARVINIFRAWILSERDCCCVFC